MNKKKKPQNHQSSNEQLLLPVAVAILLWELRPQIQSTNMEKKATMFKYAEKHWS